MNTLFESSINKFEFNDKFKSELMKTNSPSITTIIDSINIKPDPVDIIEFCPYESASNLLAFESGSNGRISIIAVNLIDDKIKYDSIENFIIGTKISSFAWSPETSTTSLPKIVKFAVATLNEKHIRILIAPIKETKSKSHNENHDDDDNSVQSINCLNDNHTDFINDLVFEPQTGAILASVGDDCFCRLWSTEDGDSIAKIRLTSAGTSIKWHLLDTSKLLISERKGIIRLINIDNKRSIMSFDSNQYPLLSADWCPANNLLIGCTSGTEIYFWDISVSSQPIVQLQAHVRGGKTFKFYNENYFASRGEPNNKVQVREVKTGRVLFEENLRAGNGITWSIEGPILAIGEYNKVILHYIKTLN